MMNNKYRFLFMLTAGMVLLSLPETVWAVPAFPGAMGFGATSAGGRGGQVIEVTNLNDSGAGSLRSCIQSEGPRVCVFRVGGTIGLTSRINVREPYLTIAGQTAPGGGILIRGTGGNGQLLMIADTHDITIRYLRLRSGAMGEPGRGQLNIAIDKGSDRIMIDHVSSSWTLDENIGIHRNIPDGANPDTWPKTENISVQRSLIAEGLYPHSTGTLVAGEYDMDGWKGTRNISIHHNLYAQNSHRNPRVMSPAAEVINNVVYNWQSRVGSTLSGTGVDWIGNYFKSGPMSSDVLLYHESRPKNEDIPYPFPSLYIQGNLAPHQGFTDPSADNWMMFEEHYGPNRGLPLPESTHRRYTRLVPQPTYPVGVDGATVVYDQVLNDVGANIRLNDLGQGVANPDAVDQRLLQLVRTGTGQSELPPQTPEEVGGYPSIQSGTPYTDADKDGMADAWEQQYLSLGAKGTLDSDGDGYTDLEEFLNGTDPNIKNDTTTTPSNTGQACEGDTNNDHIIDVLDLLNVLASWGGTVQAIDVSGDGNIGVEDLLIVLQGWGSC